MKERSEFSHVLSSFYNEIHPQFDKCIKLLCSDNALEYTQLSVAFLPIMATFIKPVVSTLLSKMV